MNNEQVAYRQARDLQGAACLTTADLERYLAQIRTDAHSLRIGLAQALITCTPTRRSNAVGRRAVATVT
ncbi:hypothetical protein ACIF6I_33860 [Streptomyces microflavus]|uniref:hypothetical protein n=1 Tax=Streptomyces microflavus TaxID=1919 RepID=UPI0037D54895